MQLQYGKFSASKRVCMQPWVADYGNFPCSLHAPLGWEIAVAPKPVCIQPSPENTSSAPKPVCMQPLMLNTSISHATCLQDLTGNIWLRATRQPCMQLYSAIYHQTGGAPCMPFNPMQSGCLLSSALACTVHAWCMLAGAAQQSDGCMAACMASFHARPHCDAAHASWWHDCHGPRNALPTTKSNNTCVCNTDNRTMRGRGSVRGEGG